MQQNHSVTEFILLGLTQDPLRQKIVFVIFLIFYMGTVVGNMLIFVTIKSSRTLGSPMYFFLFYLSIADSCFSTSTAPRLIVDALSAKKIISYNECMTQVFGLHLFGCMEIFVLILMAVDRYVAICKPLSYPTIMSRQVCIILIVLAWIGSFIHSTAQMILALRLPFYGPNLIDRDLQPLLKLACMNTYMINLLFVKPIDLTQFQIPAHSSAKLQIPNNHDASRKDNLSPCLIREVCSANQQLRLVSE
ncbi:hypothetical protein H8959_003332 [Pygathrix nigripes]